MAIFLNTDNLPAFHNAVITIGTFDGVHLGHETILNEVASHAAAINGESIVITFEPHPRKLLFPDQPIKLLTPLHQKLQLIQEAGIQHVVVAPFTRDFSMLSAEDYIEHFLVKYFRPATIIIGYDHHFGHDRKGDLDLLKQFESKYNYNVIEIPAQLIEQAAVSSTKIRKALTEGHVQDAAHMLGRDYSIAGTVIRGAQRGRTIGYPTANIRLNEPDQLIPAIGVYAARARWKDHLFDGMMSVGYNPTVTDEKKIHIEINIFDFDKEIYGDDLEVFFISYLRNEEKFPSLEALKQQIHLDKENSLSILRK